MPTQDFFLFLDTPRAGDGLGHRWVVPEKPRLPSEALISEFAARARADSEGEDYISVSRDANQTVGATSRKGRELIVAAGISCTPIDVRNDVRSVMQTFLEGFEPSTVEWHRAGRGVMVTSPLLDPLFNELLGIIPENAVDPIGNRKFRPQKRNRVKWIVPCLVAVVVFGCWLVSLMVGKEDPAVNFGNGLRDHFEEIWMESVTSPDSSAAVPPTITDAREFWELIKAEKWSGGEFVWTDFTDSPELKLFLKPGNQQKWYRSEDYKDDPAANEIERLFEAVNDAHPKLIPEEIEKELAKFALVIAAIEKSLSGEISFLDDFPINNHFLWMTPTDGMKVYLIREELKKMANAAGVEKSFGDWDDLFSEEKTTLLLRSTISNPDAANMLRPILKWVDEIPDSM